MEYENIRLFLMSNHYHLLVQTPGGNLARCMLHVNGVYTQRFNRRYKKEGQLFRGRYKAVLVEGDSHLLEVLRYIHRNPLKAGIVIRDICQEQRNGPGCRRTLFSLSSVR